MTHADGTLDALIDDAKQRYLSGDLAAFEALDDRLETQGVSDQERSNLSVVHHQVRLQYAQERRDAEPTNASAWRAWAETLRRAHRLPESTVALHEAIECCPSDLILKKQIAERYLGARCYAEALEHVVEALRLVPNDPEFLRLHAELLSRLHDPGSADAAAAAWDAQPAIWPRCMDFMLRAGAIERVRERLERLRATPEYARRASGALARMDLWHGDPEPAIRTGQALVDSDPAEPEGLFLRGAARAFVGATGARDDLEQCLESDRLKSSWVERSAVHGWLCELALGEGDFDRALRHADMSMSTAEHYSANALLNRHRVVERQYLKKRAEQLKNMPPPKRTWFQRLFGLKPSSSSSSSSSSGPGVDPRWRPVVQNYGEHVTHGPTGWDVDFSVFGEMLSFIHGHIGGNRSSISTWRSEDGALHHIPAVNYSHIGTRSIQQQLRCRPSLDIVNVFVDLCEQYPTNPGVHTYGGEVLVWIGEHARSEQYFRAALEGDYTTVWAWIGLGAARGLQGHLHEALDIFAEGIEKTQFEGPSVFVYRGEFHRLLGNLDQARRDLDKAVQHKPQRLSAWINRVLLDADSGDVGPLNTLAGSLKRTNPGLWCDAAEAASQDPLDSGAHAAVMDAVLMLMRGNRSSQVITYRLDNGELRFAKWTASDPPELLCRRYGVGISESV